MMNIQSFISQESENTSDYSIYFERPLEVSPEKWSAAIENEILSEIYDYYDSIKRLNIGKSKENYDSQRDVIILALKTIHFEKCPKISVDEHGNICVYQAYGNGGFLSLYTEDGYLSFTGNGNVCIITPQSNNLLVVYYNLDTKEKTIDNISKNVMDNLLAKKERIKLRYF